MNRDRRLGGSAVPVVNVDFIGYKMICECNKNLDISKIYIGMMDELCIKI